MKCPTCSHCMPFDHGAYYCDCTHGETFNCVCPDALKQYPEEADAEDTEAEITAETN